MSVQLRAETLAQRLFIDAVNDGAVELIADLYSPDFVDRAPGPGQPSGPAGIIEIVQRYRAAIPDLAITVEEVITCGDRVVTRETWRGTHHGEDAGVPPHRPEVRDDQDAHLPPRWRQDRGGVDRRERPRHPARQRLTRPGFSVDRSSVVRISVRNPPLLRAR